MTDTNNDNQTIHITVNKDDIVEAYEFNMQPPEYKNRRTAVLRFSPNKDTASVHYAEEGHFYPPELDPKPVHIRADDLIADRDTPYPLLSETRVLVADEMGLDREQDEHLDNDEYSEKVEAWHEEAKEVFWAGVQFENELELRDGTTVKITVEDGDA